MAFVVKPVLSMVIAALCLVACGNEEDQAAADQKAQEVEATANDLLDRMDAAMQDTVTAVDSGAVAHDTAAGETSSH